MRVSARTDSVIDLRRRLEATQTQLDLYARDLKKVLSAEREKAWKLEVTNRQLQAYAQDLKTAFFAEKQRARELASLAYLPTAGAVGYILSPAARAGLVVAH